MRILFINPNTSEEFTRKVQVIINKYALPSTEAVAKNPLSGPASIESIYDELISSSGTLELAISELTAFDAFVIACYSDHPAIYALREITEKPVVGIAEASMYMACMLGYKFSIVTTNSEWEPLLWDSVRHYGLSERCASIRTTGMQVLALESTNQDEINRLILNAAQKAIKEDGAEVICLGCAGMTGLDKYLEKELGIPIVDGVVSALKFMEGIVGYGLKTSKRLTYTQPLRKEVQNLPEIFSKPYRSA